MTAHTPGVVRAVALVGPTGVGKTTLMEALVAAAAGAKRAGNRTSIGDASAEARARGHSVELNFARFDYLDDHYASSIARARSTTRQTATSPCRRWTWRSWSPIPSRPRRSCCSQR